MSQISRMRDRTTRAARTVRRRFSEVAAADEGKSFLAGGGAGTILVATAAALAATAVVVNWQAGRAERRHPPKGRFIKVDGVRLHYIEAGEGEPVVLLHGNGSMVDDPLLSIFPALAETHRVIAFDRPGFGWSDRPHDREWTPDAQATLVRSALRRLGVERPVLYGHSFAAPIVVSFALLYPGDVRGVVAASGYYYPNFRADSLLAWSMTLPVIGRVLRNTLMPVQGAAFGTLSVKAMFAPAPMPETWAVFPSSLSLRPSQLRASGEDGRTMRAWAKRSSPHYGDIAVPLMIVAGSEDLVVDPIGHSGRLHDDVPGSRLRLWPDTGHMVHHTRPGEVIDAIEEVFEMADAAVAPRAAAGTPLDAGVRRTIDPLDAAADRPTGATERMPEPATV